MRKWCFQLENRDDCIFSKGGGGEEAEERVGVGEENPPSEEFVDRVSVWRSRHKENQYRMERNGRTSSSITITKTKPSMVSTKWISFQYLLAPTSCSLFGKNSSLFYFIPWCFLPPFLLPPHKSAPEEYKGKSGSRSVQSNFFQVNFWRVDVLSQFSSKSVKESLLKLLILQTRLVILIIWKLQQSLKWITPVEAQSKWVGCIAGSSLTLKWPCDSC